MDIINILGVKVKLESNSIRFNDFVKSSSNSYSGIGNFDIALKIHFNNSLFKSNKDIIKNIKITEYLGSEVYVEDLDLLWETRRLKVLINREVSKFEISANANFRLDQKIRSIFKSNPEFENNMYLYVHRFVILYPIMSILSNKNKYSIVHASAVFDKKENKSLLFVGLNGVGKSSLAFGLSNIERYELLSDNFVVICNDKMRIVPELIRLPRNIKHNIDNFNIIGRANNKLLIKNKTNSTEEYEVGKVVFISRDKGNSPSTLKSLSSEKALDLLYNIGSYLKEYENHHYTSFLEKNKASIDIENYKCLVDNSDNYLFKIGNEKNNVLKFLQLLNS
jgi:hypothetical protein